MRTLALSVLLALAGMASPTDSVAAASASVKISNGMSLSLEHTGFAWDFPRSSSQVFSVSVSPGQTADFSFDYAISVADDGLPVEPLPPAPGSGPVDCLPLSGSPIRFCGPPSGVDREQAAAMFVLVPEIDRARPPRVEWTIDGSQTMELQTCVRGAVLVQ
jgi:hypothetical protein